MRTIVAEYTTWSRDLIASGASAGGAKLYPVPGREFRSSADAVSVADAPFGGDQHHFGGYSLLSPSTCPDKFE